MLFAQESTSKRDIVCEDLVYSSVEVNQEFHNYIASNFKVPNVEKLKGRVIAQFIVEKDGSLSDITIIRDIGYGTAEEAKRVLENSPKWKPGIQNGKIIRVLYSVPINVGSNK